MLLEVVQEGHKFGESLWSTLSKSSVRLSFRFSEVLQADFIKCRGFSPVDVFASLLTSKLKESQKSLRLPCEVCCIKLVIGAVGKMCMKEE